ncbi:MAG TPA: hypothetical protein VM492_09030 [Sumerlaeia bacterium]|nr:hypothetical protein [Sumerlaeia bacterium]
MKADLIEAILEQLAGRRGEGNAIRASEISVGIGLGAKNGAKVRAIITDHLPDLGIMVLAGRKGFFMPSEPPDPEEWNKYIADLESRGSKIYRRRDWTVFYARKSGLVEVEGRFVAPREVKTRQGGLFRGTDELALTRQ